MPSHGPTEPPDESHGWEDEYDKIMESEEGKELLLYLYRIPRGCIENHGLDLQDVEIVESDDDALQAFVTMVYDRGMAHGHGNALSERQMALLDKEFEEQAGLMKVTIYEHVGGPDKVPVVVDAEGGPAIKYVPGEQRDEPMMKLPTEDLMGNPVKPLGIVTSSKPTERPVEPVDDVLG